MEEMGKRGDLWLPLNKYGELGRDEQFSML